MKKHKNHVREIVKTTDGYLSGKAKNKKPRYAIIVYQRKDRCIVVSKIMTKKKEQSGRVTIYPSSVNGLKETSIVDYKLYTGIKNESGQYRGFIFKNFNATGYKIGLLDFIKIRLSILKDPKRRKIVKNWKKHYK